MEFNQKIQANFDQMQATGKLFRSTLTGEEIWELYIGSFSKENNPVFRDPNSTSKNCNHCKNFIRRYGNIVTVDDRYNIITIFDVAVSEEYAHTAEVLTKALREAPIKEVFFETFVELNSLPYESCKKSNEKFQLGVDVNNKRYTKEEAEKYGAVKPEEIRTFKHLHLYLNKQFVDSSGKTIESIMGKFRDDKNVFQRAMHEIPLETLLLIRDLINQGSLLDGATHLKKIEAMIPLKQEFDTLGASVRYNDIILENYCWVKSFKFPFSKFKNELIGTLCTELAEGEELNNACQAWNKRVDPANYMKATAPITSKQIAEAKKFIEDNGYEESFSRRFATMEDIKISEILHSNTGDGKLKKVSVLDGVKATSTRHKRNEFDNVDEVSIEKFMADILPTCTSVEAFLSNRHSGNMVSLTTTNDPESKPIFKWANNYSWTFDGNLAGKSQIKEAVKNAGGRVDGVLRFSLIWNDTNGQDNSDLDAWCKQPDGQSIGFNSGFRKDQATGFSSCSGQLDLDNTTPSGKMAIENIYFSNIKKMKNGGYLFWVSQWSDRNSQGFKAEIEYNGEIFTYEYNSPIRTSMNVRVAQVIFENGVFKIEHYLPETTSYQKEIYSLESNQFHKVNLVCLSPNHWGDKPTGNKHYFFMLNGCKSPSAIRGFHNENLIPDLAEHRKVFEVLGATTMIEPADNQLSGLGFNATVRDELIVKLQGTHKRIVKIKF